MTKLTIETAALGAYADATEADLHRVVSQLNEDNFYVIVHRDGDELFAQAALGRNPDGTFSGDYVVEYAVADSDLRQTHVAAVERAYELIAGWAFDRPGWGDAQTWSVLQF